MRSLVHPQLLLATLLLFAFALSGCPAANKPQTTTTTTPGCKVNSDCSGGDVCLNAKCVQPAVPNCGSEMACTSDAQCMSMQCDPNAGCCLSQCSDMTPCASATDECLGGVCVPLGTSCQTAEDCPHASASVCDTTTGACVQCTVSTECPPGSLCMNDSCTLPVSTGCTADADCTSVAGGLLPHCDTSSDASHGDCVACNTAADCPMMGDTCPNHACLEPMTGCVFDGDCQMNPNGQYCAANGTCVACLNSNQCPTGSTCEANHTCTQATSCVTDANCPTTKPHCRPADGFCAECAVNSQCPNNQICRDGLCEGAVNGCLTSADCIPPLVICNPTTLECGRCMSNNDCPAFCTAVNGENVCTGCSQNIDCDNAVLSGTISGLRIWCNSAKACVACIGDANCDNGQICNSEGTCVTSPINMPCPSTGCGENLTCVMDGSATGTCREPCSPYNQSACGNGLICAVTGFAAGTATGACEPSSGASIGQGCSSTNLCALDAVCLPSAPGQSQCFGLCDPNSSNSCPSGDSCDPVVILSSTNVPFEVGACVPSGPFSKQCSTASSCAANQSCSAEGDPDNPTELTNECWWNVGSGGPGSGCSHGSDCKSGVCIPGMPQNQGSPGFCAGGCASDSSCPARQSDMYPGACEPYPVPWHSDTGAADTTPVVTCVTQCRDDTECPTGETCDVTPDATLSTWVTRCVPTNSTAAIDNGGAICASDADCYSGHCLSINGGMGGVCAGVCNPSNNGSDCASGSTCPTGGVVLQLPAANGNPSGNFQPAPICWERTCTDNTQCGPAGTCGEQTNATNTTQIVLYCQPRQGTKEGGASCSADLNCESGFCVQWSTGPACFGVCVAANGMTGNPDCAAGAMCEDNVTWPGSNPAQIVSICMPP